MSMIAEHIDRLLQKVSTPIASEQESLPPGLTVEILSSLNKLGWSRIKHLRPDLSQFDLRTTLDGEEVLLHVTISKDYPSSPPILSSDEIPVEILKDLREDWYRLPVKSRDFLSLYRGFRNHVHALRPTWNLLRSLDKSCWVRISD